MAFTILEAFLFIVLVAMLAWIILTGVKTIQMLFEDMVESYFDRAHETERELQERLDEEEWESNAGDPVFIGRGT
jgi:hypothetical protein